VNLASAMNVRTDYASTERLKGASNCVGTTWATSRGKGPFDRANYTLAGTAISFVLRSCESNGMGGIKAKNLKEAINEATVGGSGGDGRRQRQSRGLRKCEKTKGQSCTNNVNGHSNLFILTHLVPRPNVHGVTTPDPSLPSAVDRTIVARYGGGAPATATLALALRVVQTSEPSSGSINSGLQAPSLLSTSLSRSLFDSNPRALELSDVRGV